MDTMIKALLLIILVCGGTYYALGTTYAEEFKLTPIITVSPSNPVVTAGELFTLHINLDFILPDPASNYEEYLYAINYKEYIIGDKAFNLYKGETLKRSVTTDSNGNATMQISESEIGAVTYTLSFEGGRILQKVDKDVMVTVQSSGEMVTLSMNLGGGQGTTTPALGDELYSIGQSVTLTAEAAIDFTFQKWVINDVDEFENPVTITMDVDKFVVVYFQSEATTVTLILSINGEGTTVPAPGTHTYNTGEIATLTATSASGWLFGGWHIYMGETLYDNPLSLQMIANYDITCVFIEEWIIYDLTVTSTIGGTTNPTVGIHPYNSGTIVTVSATPNSGYQFVQWEIDTTNIKISQSVDILMDTTHTAHCVFEEITQEPYFAVTLSTTTLTMIIQETKTVTITYTSMNGYTGTIGYSTNLDSMGFTIQFTPSIKITLEADTSTDVILEITASNNYRQDPYTGTITSSDGGVTTYDKTLTVIVQNIPTPILTINPVGTVEQYTHFTIDIVLTGAPTELTQLDFVLTYDNTKLSYSSYSFDETKFINRIINIDPSGVLTITLSEPTSTMNGIILQITYEAINIGNTQIDFITATYTYSDIATKDLATTGIIVQIIEPQVKTGTLYVRADVISQIWDINGDGNVNDADQNIILACYGAKEGDENFDSRCDLNKDGEIGIFDINHFLPQLGTVVSAKITNIDTEYTITITPFIYWDGAYNKDHTQIPKGWNKVGEFETIRYTFRIEIITTTLYAQQDVVIETRKEWEPTLIEETNIGALKLASFSLLDNEITMTVRDIFLVLTFVFVIILLGKVSINRKHHE